MRHPFACITLTLLLGLPAARAEFFFQESDHRIVFLGDSITEQRRYTTYLEAYLLTRFPQRSWTFRNAGWGGDTAWLMKRGPFDEALQRDVLALHPQAVLINFGMNDARDPEVNFPLYVQGLASLTQKIRAAGARVALVTPSPEEGYEEDEPGGSGYNQHLAKYAKAVRQIAAQEHTGLADVFKPFLHFIEQGREARVLGRRGEPRLVPDQMHPNWAGHLLMAWAILKDLEAPALVSSATCNARTQTVLEEKKCRVKFLPAAKGEVRLQRWDEALPMPLWPESALAFQLPNNSILQDLNLYLLRVTGLSARRYNLQVDGIEAGSFTAKEWEVGVNLATLTAGPLYEQGQKLLQTIIEKNNLYFNRWRQVQLYQPPVWLTGPETETRRSQQLHQLDGEIAHLEEVIQTLRQPKVHEFCLRPVASPSESDRPIKPLRPSR